MMNKTTEYENLMRWVINDIGDLAKDEKRLVSKYFNYYLINTVTHLDIHGIIRNNADFKEFRNDLMGRIGILKRG